MQSTYFLKLSTITIPPPHPKKRSIKTHFMSLSWYLITWNITVNEKWEWNAQHNNRKETRQERIRRSPLFCLYLRIRAREYSPLSTLKHSQFFVFNKRRKGGGSLQIQLSIHCQIHIPQAHNPYSQTTSRGYASRIDLLPESMVYLGLGSLL